MAHTPQNDIENARSREPSLSGETFAYNDSSEDQTSANFKASLSSFAYSPNTTLASHYQPRSGSPRFSVLMATRRSGRNATLVAGASNGVMGLSSQKRAANESITPSVPPKKQRSTKKDRAAADPYNPDNKLVDSLRPGLTLVFIGLNPGLMTAATGHAYAHPSNLFWKILHWSGITTKQHHPSETHDLPDLYSIGNTNICARPTRNGAGLSKEEQIEGASILEEKVAKHKPEAVCIVGKGIWDVIYKSKTGKVPKGSDFKYGWQDEHLWLGRVVDKDGTVQWAGSRTFVATTTSGLAAGMKPQEKLDIWKPLGDWVQERRGDKVKDEDGDEEVKVETEEE